MTIIKSSYYLENYPFFVIEQSVISVLRDALIQTTENRRVETTLKIFECYCHITSQSLNYLTLSSSAFEITVRGYLGALYEDDFLTVTDQVRKKYARGLVLALVLMRKNIPEMPLLEWSPSLPEECHSIWRSLAHNLDMNAVEYWCGWEIAYRKKSSAYLKLAPLWHSHGHVFTRVIYKQWRTHAAKRIRGDNTLINSMAKYLSDHPDKWPVSTFNNPLKIIEFFQSFLEHHFREYHGKQIEINSQLKLWSQFISNIEEAFIQSGIWAKPFGEGIPKPKPKAIYGAKARIRRTENGVDIKEKLITDVPLQVTDHEAIEILFCQIKADIKVVIDWAEAKVLSLYNRYQQRKELAKIGTPIDCRVTGEFIDELGFENICATFERDGFRSYLMYDWLRSRVYIDKAALADQLGLPTKGSLFPYQLLLVAENPNITPTYLEQFELYDKRGNIAGFINTGSGYQLIGFKDRNGKRLAEQKINLSERSALLVKQVIEITEPLRQYLSACFKRSELA